MRKYPYIFKMISFNGFLDNILQSSPAVDGKCAKKLSPQIRGRHNQ